MPNEDAAPGTLSGRFGRYEIEGLLGAGGMGAVYKARQIDLDRPVVVKVIAAHLAKDENTVKRLQREARSAAKVASDQVVQVYETGIENGIPFIAMEFIDGCSLADLLTRRGKLPWPEATRLTIAAARGLEAAHEKGVLHRDVKPANILVGNDGRVKVADFGLAKLETLAAPSAADGAALSLPGQIVGTPYYMAPEQGDGQPVDARADIYALGVTYYELLTGKRPFVAATPFATLALVFKGNPTHPRALVPDLPEEVERACLRMMHREVESRPKSAREAFLALEAIVASTPSGRLPVDATQPTVAAPLRDAKTEVLNSAAPSYGRFPGAPPPPGHAPASAPARNPAPSGRPSHGRIVMAGPAKPDRGGGGAIAILAVLAVFGLAAFAWFQVLQHRRPAPEHAAPPVPPAPQALPAPPDPASDPPPPPPAVEAPPPTAAPPPVTTTPPPAATDDRDARAWARFHDIMDHMPPGPAKFATWQKFVEEYPGTAAAAKAQTFIDHWGKPPRGR
jgi:serine/threonine-protein kinase